MAHAGLPRYAIIGGVAVIARLGGSHRVTTDLDAVVDDDLAPTALEVLTRLDGARIDPTVRYRIHLAETTVELIGTHSITDKDLAELDHRQALFVASHRWALDTATPLTLLSDDPALQATVQVARPSALVAMKLGAIQDRRVGGVIDKRGGDAWDLYRILTELDINGGVLTELSTAPAGLRHAVADAAHKVLVADAGRTKGWLAAGEDRMAAVTVDELRYIGERLLAELRPGPDIDGP
jgi:hypothetical protein